MKKQLLVAAVIFAAVSAQASKARLNALGNSEHIVDIQEVFQQEPDQALNYEAATVEFGGNTGAGTEAEGGFIRKMGDSAWSAYIGRSSTTFKSLTDGVTALATAGGIAASAAETTALRAGHDQANPLQLTYAGKASDISYGASLLYVGNEIEGVTYTSGGSNFGGAGVTTDQNVMGLLIGANNGVWDVQLRQGIVGEMETKGTAGLGNIGALAGATNLKLESTGSTKLSGGYLMDTMYFYGGVELSSAEVTANSTTAISRDIDSNIITAGVVNSHKKDGIDFFYGISAVMTTTEIKNNVSNVKTEVDSLSVPMLVGVEAEVSSWMTLRGSLSQPLSLLSSSETKVGTASAVGKSPTDATVTALGAGFKWGKANIDAVVSTGTDGNFGVDSGGDILTQASVTYNF
jgi:hypothetical protein